MSFWTGANQGDGAFSDKYNNTYRNKIAAELTLKSIESIKAAYGEINLITDNKGAEIFGCYDWTTIDTSLEQLPKEYGEVWSLGKLKAFNIIANKGEPFFHFDHDVFINKRLPPEIESAGVVFQSPEYIYSKYHYDLPLFIRGGVCPHRLIPDNFTSVNDTGDITRDIVAFNCGVVGGLDVDFFKFYSHTALEMVLHPANAKLWLTPNSVWMAERPKTFMSWTKAVLAEQYHAAVTCNYLNITPTFVVPQPYDQTKMIRDWETGIERFNYVHLFGGFKSRLNIDRILNPNSIVRNYPIMHHCGTPNTICAVLIDYPESESFLKNNIKQLEGKTFNIDTIKSKNDISFAATFIQSLKIFFNSSRDTLFLVDGGVVIDDWDALVCRGEFYRTAYAYGIFSVTTECEIRAGFNITNQVNALNERNNNIEVATAAQPRCTFFSYHVLRLFADLYDLEANPIEDMYSVLITLCAISLYLELPIIIDKTQVKLPHRVDSFIGDLGQCTYTPIIADQKITRIAQLIHDTRTTKSDTAIDAAKKHEKRVEIVSKLCRASGIL
jgi:hypothetical protein